MSEFETVALIVIFLVLSAIIVRLIGGDADIEPMTRRVRGNPQPPPDAATASPSVRQQPHTATPQRSEPAKPRPVEPAMVKVDLPPPTPIPDPRIAQVQTAAAPAAKSVAPSAAEALAAVRAAAPAPQPVTPTAASPVAPAPKTAVEGPTATAVQASTATAVQGQTANVAPIRPSAAATLSPDVQPKTEAPHVAQRPAPADPVPAVQKPAPVAAAADKRDIPPPPQVRASEPRDAATTPAASATVTLSRPDVTATLAPGATPSPAAMSTQPAAKQLSGEDQAIISRYLRPDVKATLFRDPPPGWTPPPAPAPRAIEPPPPAAPRAAPVAPPSGPLVISQPRIEATVPPGYQAPAPQPKAGPVGPATGFAPLGILPDARATIAGGEAPSAKPLSAAAAPQAAAATPPTTDDVSPRALRAASIPPSTAVDRPIVSQPQSPSSDPAFLSTAKRGTRVIGADAAPSDTIDLERSAPPRPQTPSIWSNTVPRRVITDSEILTSEAAIAPPSVRAERIPVRAGTLLVRPDAARTIDPSAPKYTSIPKPPPVASLRSEARPLPESGRYANVRFTLPPGALGEE